MGKFFIQKDTPGLFTCSSWSGLFGWSLKQDKQIQQDKLNKQKAWFVWPVGSWRDRIICLGLTNNREGNHPP